jgi:hypothetical protein
MPLSAVATAQELSGEEYDRLHDMMPSAMQLQPLINLVICPARPLHWQEMLRVTLVGGSGSAWLARQLPVQTPVCLSASLERRFSCNLAIKKCLNMYVCLRRWHPPRDAPTNKH